MLCAAQTTSKKRSGYRVIKTYGKKKFNLPKVLVTSIYGHDDMIKYLSAYRTQDKMGGVHYYPSGALCWFETNRYGDPTGTVYYIKKVPDMKLIDTPRRQRTFRNILVKKEMSLKEKLTKENIDTEEWMYKKVRFHQ